MDDLQTHVTQILQQCERTDSAREQLLPLVYDQLRAIAQRRMSEERSDHTLQATALVHEVYMKLVGGEGVAFESRRHFFAVAAEAMRRILIDHARKRDSQKRGGGKAALPLNVVDLAADADPADVLAVDEALTRLQSEDPRAAQIVQLRFFAGLSVEETAEVMGLSERTVMREWSFARARLFQMLDPGGEP
jgi:RNA polymerase sigma-70 factor (ECF subfamily)